MSILGVVIRVHSKHLEGVRQRLARTPGVDPGPEAGNCRLAAVIESTAETPAAAIMSDIGAWPEVLNLSLVFEHGDDDGDQPRADAGFDFRAWRGHVGEFARRQAQESSFFVSPSSTSAASGAGETP